MRYNLNVSGHGCKLIEASIINFICSLTASEGDYQDVIDELKDLLLKIFIFIFFPTYIRIYQTAFPCPIAFLLFIHLKQLLSSFKLFPCLKPGFFTSFDGLIFVHYAFTFICPNSITNIRTYTTIDIKHLDITT